MRIAIASGKGGTGKTFVATGMFHSLCAEGKEVVLVDCDAEAPNTGVFFQAQRVHEALVSQKVPVIDKDRCTYCGKCDAFCNYHAIFILPGQEVILVMEDLCHACGACLLACEEAAITEKEVTLGWVTSYLYQDHWTIIEARTRIGTMTPVPLIRHAMKILGKDEGFALFDAPPGTSCPFIHTVVGADFVILVTEPTPFGLSDLKRSVDTLRQLSLPFGVIVNRAGLGDHEVYDYLERENISLLLEIAYNQQIAELYAKGEVAAARLPWLRQDFLKVLSKIIDENGSCGNQR